MHTQDHFDFFKILFSSLLALLIVGAGVLATPAKAAMPCDPEAAAIDDQADQSHKRDNERHHKKHHRKHKAFRAGPGMPGEMPHHRMKRVLRKLNLTDTQKAEIKSIREAKKEETKALRLSLCQLHQKMAEQIETKPLDEQAIRALAMQIGEVKTSLLIKNIQTMQSIETLLTEEQQQKLAQIKKRKRPPFGPVREDEEEE